MSIVIAENLSKYYGAQDIFSGLSFQVAHGDKIALVGANGVGKTTLLRIIAGLESPSSGRLQIAKGIRIGYLSQKADVQEGRTLYQEMLEVFAYLRAQQERLRRLEEGMSHPERRAKAMERYGELLQLFELAGGYTYEHEIRRVLTGLGFKEADFEQPVARLSGGQRTRAQLAKLLLSNPDLLLLDEPTNHLDLQATQWLEEYLYRWKGSLIVVAHDRYFLDQVANRVWEMSFGALEQYPGNYSHYMAVRAERHRQRQAEYEAQKEYLERTEEFIRRYKAGQRSREARSREKRLQHLERLERPKQEKRMKFELANKVRGGNNVLTVRGLVVGYDWPLFRCPDLLLIRRQCVALVGPNGCGKTTFLKTILGEVPPLAGEVRIGANVQVAYLAQGHENLCEENTVLEELLRVKNLPIEMARSYLGRFLFSGDEVFKRVADLSGGERSRVALAMLALQGANFLLLDEPTNQLDIPSQELLEQVLQNFDGTILFVSHNRYFIEALSTQLWVIDNGMLRVYPGNYSAYLEQVERENARPEVTTATREHKLGPRQMDGELLRAEALSRQREERRVQLEEQIQQLEQRLSWLTHELELASRAQRVDRVYDLGREYAELQEELQKRLEEWTTVA